MTRGMASFFALALACAPVLAEEGDDEARARIAALEAEIEARGAELMERDRRIEELQRMMQGQRDDLERQVQELRRAVDEAHERLDGAIRSADAERHALVEREDQLRQEIQRIEQEMRELSVRAGSTAERADAAEARLKELIESMRPVVLAELAAGEVERRARAIHFVAATGIQEAVPLLLPMVDRPDAPPAERREAVHALIALGARREAAERLRAAAADAARGPEERAEAFGGMLECSPPEALLGLRPLADSLGDTARLTLAERHIAADQAPPAAELLMALSKGPGETGTAARGALAELLQQGGEGVDYAALWERCGEGTVEGTRANADALRKFGALLVSVDFTDTPLADVAEFLSDYTGHGFHCGPEAREVRVTLKVEDLALVDVIDLLVRAAGVTTSFRFGSVVFATPGDVERASQARFTIDPPTEGDPAWLVEARSRLRTQRLTVDFSGTPLGDAVMYLREVTGLGFVVLTETSSAEILVNLKMSEVPVERIIAAICADAGIAAHVRWGAVVIGSAEGLDRLGADRKPAVEASEADRAVEMNLASRKLDICYSEMAFEDGIQFLRDYAGIEIRYADGFDPAEASTLNLEVKEATLERALHLLLRPIGLTFDVANGGIEIRPLVR